MMNGLPDEELMCLPAVKNKKIAAVMEFLNRLGEIALLAGNPDNRLLQLVLLRGARLTLENGKSSMKSVCLMAWAIFLTQSGCFSDALHMGRIALRCAETTEGGENDLRAKMYFYFFVSHWQTPYQDSIDACVRCLKDLWNVGSIDTVLVFTLTYLRLYFASGLRLEPLDADCRRYFCIDL